MSPTGGPSLIQTHTQPSLTRCPRYPPRPRRCLPRLCSAGRLLPCALLTETVSGNFSRQHVLSATTTQKQHYIYIYIYL